MQCCTCFCGSSKAGCANAAVTRGGGLGVGTFVLCFRSALNAHFHRRVIDGVFTAGEAGLVRFTEAGALACHGARQDLNSRPRSP